MDNYIPEKMLTTEQIKNRFDNPFALVNYAIGYARKKMARGEGIDSNPLNEVLEDIATGDDIYEFETDEEDEETL